MKTELVNDAFNYLDNIIYPTKQKEQESIPDFGNRNYSLLGLIGIVVIDSALLSIKAPLLALECAALTIINLVGSLFTSECTIREALDYAEQSFHLVIHTPFDLVRTALNIVPQFIRTICNPSEPHSIEELRSKVYDDENIKIWVF